MINSFMLPQATLSTSRMDCFGDRRFPLSLSFLILPKPDAKSLGGTPSRVTKQRLRCWREQEGEESWKNSCSFWGEESGDVACKERDREEREEAVRTRTSGQTPSTEQLCSSRCWMMGEVVTSSRCLFSRMAFMNLSLDVWENLGVSMMVGSRWMLVVSMDRVKDFQREGQEQWESQLWHTCAQTLNWARLRSPRILRAISLGRL